MKNEFEFPDNLESAAKVGHGYAHPSDVEEVRQPQNLGQGARSQ